MPFGCSISCSMFECSAKFLEYFVKQHAGHSEGSILHYFDDFLFGEKGAPICVYISCPHLSTMSDSVVPVAEDKTKCPTTNISFLDLKKLIQRKWS